jgi:hypothetical protein
MFKVISVHSFRGGIGKSSATVQSGFAGEPRTFLRQCHPIEPYRRSLDRDADPPAYAADSHDICGQMST